MIVIRGGEDKDAARRHETMPPIDFKSSTGKDLFGLKLCEIYVVFVLRNNFCLRGTFSLIYFFFKSYNVFYKISPAASY